MSKAAVARLQSLLGDRVLATSDFRGDDEITVAPASWLEVAKLLKEDPELAFDHFGDLTAVDYPEREPDGPRFDVLLSMRSLSKRHRIRVRTRIADGEKLATLSAVWAGANWAEREVWDMFGIEFAEHPDLRRILLYEEFEGHPLRKDYPIDRVQPLVPYRDVADVRKLAPFGIEEGQPFARINWEERLAGRDEQVSPAIAVQMGQKRTLSDSEIAESQQEQLRASAPTPEAPEAGE
jgi:NADH-quinone oxidoreductase subunit C